MISSTKACIKLPDGSVAPSRSLVRQDRTNGSARRDGAGDLARDVWEYAAELQPPSGIEPDRYGRVQVRAGDIADGIDHREHHEPKHKRDAGVRDCPAGRGVHDDGRRPREDEAERAKELSRAFLHR
jgi:hypothetical protein